MEIKNVRSKKMGEPVHSNNRAVWVTKYKMHKVKVFRNVNGEVVKEIPFVEYVFRLFVVGKTLWLSENLLVDLREVLGELEESLTSSPFSVEEEVRAAVRQLKRGG